MKLRLIVLATAALFMTSCQSLSDNLRLAGRLALVASKIVDSTGK